MCWSCTSRGFLCNQEVQVSTWQGIDSGKHRRHMYTMYDKAETVEAEKPSA